eukprot:CAMPEP_0184337496 /NCGR_PEP_ID=MMETSP1089-20130417/5898_1 /TAXON_ID=38269 ORGANISM="Gloeochaete wittrockiana, Strain SAG46.84" /NCGR_SAMPLE_ID=MMETSP1089 /ASSEMBLY_ACC=CAM_ASM_000445 /LENGTH=299 /DNA_ID=CAMNT_0026663285 /DNA_START=62 /DNA_END=961 /DNA_ORIENTATION=+
MVEQVTEVAQVFWTSLLKDLPSKEQLETFSISDKAHLMNAFPNAMPITAEVLYVLLLVVFPRLFPKDHKGFNIKPLVAVWNLFLTVVSVQMFVGIIVPYWDYVQRFGFWNVVCDKDQNISLGDPAMLYWGYVFALSKYFELFDTVFLLLKRPGRKVEFLHWYHHMTVLAFTWYAFYFRLSAGFQFTLFNAFVHSFMYFYYFLRELNISPPTFVQQLLTSLQIFQMIYGIYINTNWAIMWFNDGCECASPEIIMISCAIMYGSYLFLFLKFFFQKYFGGKRPTVTSVPATSGPSKAKKDD